MKLNARRATLPIIISGTMLLNGCQLLMPKPNDPCYAPPSIKKLIPPKNKTGSLYQMNHSLSLFEDNKAHHIGDMLTVRLIERTDASKQSSVDIEKSTTSAVNDGTVLGQMAHIGKYTLRTALGSDHEFEGSGDTMQSNDLTGTITVSIVDVLPNGYLMIRGEKWLTINQGDEYIRLTGIVRPGDVDATNTVDSTRIANARISYSGRGQDSDANRMGWLTRFFTSVLFPV